MENTSYKLLLNSTINGVNARIKEIVWIQGDDSCLTVPCYKENEYIVIELKPDCVGPGCIEGYVVFGDECTNCLPLPFKKCFCTTKADCEDCEDCSSDGICISKCKPGEFCDGNDNCVECDPTHPCPGGQICKLGKCVCPKGKFWNGTKCIECDSTTKLSKCEECINGEIKPKICDGACNPATGDCVECITNTQCADNTDGRNCCNGNLECDCCPGYIWDATKQKCIVNPCPPELGGPCKQCTDEGWVAVKCPPNHRCDPDLDTCVYDPCNNSDCTDGTDCGKECGCKDTFCVECAKLSCEECSKALGCKCNPITGKCEKDNKCDETPCVTKYDCSDDCGCDESICQECSNFSCEDCANRPGCKCVDGVCVGDGDRGCKDTLTLQTNKCDASLSGKLTKTQPCACETISSKVSIDNTLASTIKFSLRKGVGSFDSLLPLLDPAALNNSQTENQLTSLQVKLTLTALDAIGGQVKAPNSIIKNYSVINEETQLGSVSVTGLTPVQVGKITKVKLTISIVDLQFKDNKCSYEDAVVFEDFFNPIFTATTVTFKTDDLVEPIIKYGELSSSDYRDPLFIWYRSKNSSFGAENIIRKQYIPFANGSYTDKLTLDTGFLPKFDYRLETDCTCADPVTLEDVVICEDINLPIKLTQCNTRLEFTDDIKICDLSNTNLAPYIGKGVIKPNTLSDIEYANTVFELLVNGVKLTEFRSKEDKILRRNTPLAQTVNGLIVENGDAPITSVSLVVKVDGVVKCEVKKDFPEVALAVPVITTTCKEGSSEVIVKFVASPNSPITKVVYNEGNYPASNSVVNITIPKDGTYTFDIYFTSGCIKTVEQTVTCCEQKSIKFVENINSTTAITETTITNTEGTTFFLVRKGFGNFAAITTDYGIIDANKNLFLTFDEVSGISGERTVTVTITENGCVKTAVLKITRLPLEFTVSPSQCGEGTLTLTGMAGYTYNITGVASSFASGSLPTSGTITIPTNNGASTTKNYTLTTYNTFPTNITLAYTKLNAPIITGIVSTDGLSCANTLKLNIQVSGSGLTESTVVTYKIGAGGDLVEAVLVKDSLNNFILSIDRPSGTSVNLFLTKVSNGGVCETELNISQNLAISNISSISVNTPTCNALTNLFSVVLTLDPAYNISTDSIVFNPPLPSGVSYSNSTKTISGIPENSNLTFDAAIVFGSAQQCFTILNIQTGSCDCQTRSVNISSNPVICKTTIAGATSSTLTKTPTTDTEFIIGDGAGLTFTVNLNSDIKVYLTKGLGSLNEYQLKPEIFNDINYNPFNSRLAVNSVFVPVSFLAGVNYNDLKYKVVIAAKGNYCETTIERSLTVNNLDSIPTSSLTAELYYNPNASPVASFDFNSPSYPGPLNLNLANPVYIRISSGTTLPASALINVEAETFSGSFSTGVINITFTGAEINANTAIAEIAVNPGSTIISTLVINIDRQLGEASCGSEIKYVVATNISGEYVFVTKYNGVSYDPISAPQNLCVLNAVETFGHDYVGPETVTAHEWTFDGVVIGNGATVTFDPASNSTGGINKLLQVKLNLGNGEILYGNVLVKVNNSVTPTFDLPTAPVATGYAGGTFTLPASTNGITGSWSPSTLNTSTPSSVAVKTSTFTPTGGQCAITVNYTLVVNTPAPVSTPDINISGPSTGCESVVLSISLQNATQYFVTKVQSQLASCPPSGLSALTASTYTATSSGTYYFMATDGVTCSPIKSFLVTANPRVAVSPSGLPTSVSLGTSLTLPSTVSGVSGSWSPSSSVDTSTIGFRTHTFIPVGCYTNLIHTIEVTCPVGSTVSISNLGDVCATSFTITSSYYDTFTSTINGGLIVSGNTLARTNFVTGANTIDVIATKSGVPCTETFSFSYSKCQTCTLGVCDPCSDVPAFTVSYDLEAPKEVRLNLHTSYNLTYAAISSKTFTGGDYVGINNTLPNNKGLRVIWDMPNQCADAGPNSITVNYSFAYTPSGGSPIICNRQFIYNFTMAAVTYVPTGGSVFGAGVIQDEGAYVLGFSNNITYNSTQSFTISGPDLVDGTITFELDIAADNYLAVEINGNPITSHGVMSNSTLGFDTLQTTVIDKADLISGVNALALAHYNETSIMSLYVKIHRLVSGVRSSILYDAHVDLPILSC